MPEIISIDTAKKIADYDKYKTSHDLLCTLREELIAKVNSFKRGQAQHEEYTDSYKSKIEEDLEILEVIQEHQITIDETLIEAGEEDA